MISSLDTTQKIRAYREISTPKIDVNFLEKKIIELKERTASFEEMSKKKTDAIVPTIILKTDRGEATSERVFSHKNIAIAKTSFSENCATQMHYHDEIEIGTVIEGELTIVYQDGTEESFGEQDTFIIHPNVGHGSYNTVKTQAILTTIPPSKFWP